MANINEEAQNEPMETQENSTSTEMITTETKNTGLTGTEKGLLVAGGVLAAAGVYHAISNTVRLVKKGVKKVKAKVAEKKAESETSATEEAAEK